nr:hypothetical protein [Tanacetum cinerariifolium]
LDDAAVGGGYRRPCSEMGDESFEGHNSLGDDSKPKLSPLRWDKVRAASDREELTLCVGKEAITFNLDQTSRYSANYNDMTVNRIDVIDMACEEYSQEVLGFFDVTTIDAFLALEDDPTSPEVDHSYYDTEGDILLLEAFLNNDPSLPLPLKETPEVELKDLPPHLKYAFLEGEDKLAVIIAKDLSVEEKAALVKVLKSHKRAIA